MKRLRISVAATLAAVLALIALTGCAATPAPDNGQPSPGAQSDPSASTHQITDVYGRVVDVPAEVNAVATVGSAARIAVYAGAQDKLVAITEMDTPPAAARPYTMAWADLFADLPTTSNGAHLLETSVDGEKLLEIHPDLVVSSRSAAECDDLQAKIGIPVIGISYQDQMFSDDVYASILAVGEAAGTAEHAQATVDALKGWQADLAARTADIPEDERPTCYAGAVNYKGAKSFGGTYAGYPPFEAVNAANVADQSGQKASFEVTLEQIGEWDPDVMFLNAGNMDLMSKEYADNQAFFDSLSAFQNGRIYTQPSYNMNGTNVEMAVCDAYFVGATLYPERFADVDLAEKYDEIFTVMLGKPYYEQMKATGMDFATLSF